MSFNKLHNKMYQQKTKKQQKKTVAIFFVFFFFCIMLLVGGIADIRLHHQITLQIKGTVMSEIRGKIETVRIYRR